MVFLSGGCSHGPITQPGSASSELRADLGQTDYQTVVGADYVLRPSDVLRLTVFREPDLSLESVAISADGFVSVPLVGSVAVAGQTVRGLEAELERVLGSRYLRNPDVSVNVIDYASHQVSVEGAVKRPGLYKFIPGTRLSGGIVLAEGADRVADSGQVAVFRQTAQGTQIAKFDYQAMQNGTMLDPVLQPGDRVIVGTNSLSQFWQDLLKALPAFAIFSSI